MSKQIEKFIREEMGKIEGKFVPLNSTNNKKDNIIDLKDSHSMQKFC